MAINISDDTSGRLALDLSEEPEVSMSTGFKNLLFAFSIVSRDAERIILDPGDQSAEPVAYLLEGLRDLGYNVVLSEALRSLYNSYQAEMNLMTQLSAAVEEETRPFQTEEAAILHQIAPSFALLPHQEDGLAHMLAVRNAANFSVQGSGKTAVVLAAFAVWRSEGLVDKLLVIGPVSCFRPWEEEYERCFRRPPQRLRWSGSVLQRTRLVPEFHRSELVLCSYDTAIRDERMLTSLLRHTHTLLVLDESHYIKNFDIGARARAVLQLGPSATFRVTLTGTPAPHTL
jgi:SNF2 family DNA or RNA helicase